MILYLQELCVFLRLLLEFPESSPRPEDLSFLQALGVLDLHSLPAPSLFTLSFFLSLCVYSLTPLRC